MSSDGLSALVDVKLMVLIDDDRDQSPGMDPRVWGSGSSQPCEGMPERHMNPDATIFFTCQQTSNIHDSRRTSCLMYYLSYFHTIMSIDSR